MTTESKLIDLVGELAEKHIELSDRTTDLEQQAGDRNSMEPYSRSSSNLGKAITDNDVFKNYISGNGNSCRVDVKTALINATGASQPLVAGDRLAGIVTGANRRLSIRDLLPTAQTSSNVVEYAKENVYTNNAGPQVGGSPEAFENVLKNESGVTFTLATAAVTTLAHHIPVSKQVLSDAPLLGNYLENRLLYGLRLKEDSQLLLGTGSNGELNGLYTNRTAYATTSPLAFTNKLDILRDAISQIEAVDFEADGIVLNSADWADIQTAKVGTSDDRYVYGDPALSNQRSLWGLPVIVSNTMTAGSFLVGSFANAAQIFDRENATVEIGLTGDQFTRNMVTILVEMRLTLAIYRGDALVGGSFTV